MSNEIKKTAGRKAYSSEKIELIKHKIIEAAEYLFTQLEFSEITMQRIATQANIAKGSVYNYFKNKTDLYIVITTRMFNEAYIEYRKAVSNETTYADKFIAFNRAKLIFFRKYTHYLLLTNKFYYEVYKINFEEITEEHYTDFKDTLETGYHMMREILEGGKEKGEFRSDLNIKHVISEFAKSSRAMLNYSILDLDDTNEADEFHDNYIYNCLRILK